MGLPTSLGPFNLTVQFTDLSTGVITEWRWDFNNDGIKASNETNPQYTYPYLNATYNVALTVVGPDREDTEIKYDYITATGCGG